MTVSKTAIGNRALQKLGETRVSSIGEDSKAGRALSANYDIIRDDLLRAHPWNFAIKRTTLEALDETPAFGFSNVFALPTDCLRVVQVGDARVQIGEYRAGSDAPHQIEGGKVLTNDAGPLKLRYVRRVTDETLFDMAFVEALACRLAFELAEEITNSTTKAERAEAGFARAIRRATMLDAIENPPEGIPDDSWVHARL